MLHHSIAIVKDEDPVRSSQCTRTVPRLFERAQ
jgi:hypothetical protein